MFAFEFAILLITSLGILSRYTISLVEKYILYREATKRREARVAERAERLRAMQAAGGEEQEEEEEEDDELDVGGWEEKGTWVFYSELCTGMCSRLSHGSTILCRLALRCDPKYPRLVGPMHRLRKATAARDDPAGLRKA
jgi:hypothetical protein